MIVRLNYLLNTPREWSLRRSFWRFGINDLIVQLLALSLAPSSILYNIAWSPTRFARKLVITLNGRILLLLNLVHWLQMLLRLIWSSGDPSSILSFSLAGVSLSIDLCLWPLMVVVLCSLLAIQHLRITLILKGWSMMTSLLWLNHFAWFGLFDAYLVVKNHRVDLIDTVCILILNVVIRCPYNPSFAIFFSWVVR